MVILDLRLDHIMEFNGFHINFSFPKKLTKSTLEEENLQAIPSFRYKKLAVFVGANASGKTSLMRAIAEILEFLSTKDTICLKSIVDDFYPSSFLSIDFVDAEKGKNFLSRVKIRTFGNGTEGFRVELSSHALSLAPGDSYERKAPLFDQMKDEYQDYSTALTTEKFFAQNLFLPATEKGFAQVKLLSPEKETENQAYLAILNNVLHTLDPSIKMVARSQDTKDAIVITHEHGEKIIVQEGNRISAIQRLSSGSKYGINLANLLFSLKYHRQSIYLIDEQFSYISSDIEVSMLSAMAEMLTGDEQIFFTTHNQNILQMSFPLHSFYFLRKETNEDGPRIQVLCAAEKENRNNVSPYHMAENDMFGAAPDVSLIYQLVEHKGKQA